MWRTLAVAALGCGFVQQAAAIELVGDTNRDGVVDFASDLAGRGEWTAQRGAVFLFNVDSSDGTTTIDADDSIINGPEDLDDLAVLRLRRMGGAPPPGSTLTITSNAPASIRLFQTLDGTTYTAVAANGVVPAALAEEGELRIEARSFANQSWNGRVRVTATLTLPGGGSEVDSVELRVAPFLMLSNKQAGLELYVREHVGRNEAFISQLTSACAQLGVGLVVIPGDAYPTNQIWLQDQMEIGYTEMPGRRMHAILRANRNQAIDEWPRTGLLGPGYGFFTVGSYRSAFAGGGSGNGWLDWYGNLEVTPPLPGWPHGRILYGVNGSAGLNPEIVAMLNAQELQGPALALDSGWLLIKHVDEFVCFVPSTDPARPWKVLVPDTNVMLALYDRWIAEGRGSLPMLRRFYSNTTVSSLRNSTTNRNYNSTLQTNRINPVIEVLKASLGLDEGHIVRIPAWYERYGSTQDAASMMPNMVNAVVMNGAILAADPNGPIVGGIDLVQQEFESILTSASIPLQSFFLDDRQYHLWSGNVHCATNVKREPFSQSIWKPEVAGSGSVFLLY
jgi:protein-arginine deiminase